MASGESRLPMPAAAWLGPKTWDRAASAAITLTLAGAAVKCIATVKEVVVAGVYGRSDDLDAFLIACLIPSLMVNLVPESMSQVLIPGLIRIRAENGEDEARSLLATCIASMVVALTGIAVLLGVFGRPVLLLLTSHFAAETVTLTVRLFYLMLPSVVFTGIATCCIAVLSTLERFAGPSLSVAALPLTILIAVPAAHRWLGIWALAGATLAGSMLQAALCVRMLQATQYGLRFVGRLWSPRLRTMTRGYLSMMLSSILSSAGVTVDQAMAAMLPAGSVSALVYGTRFVSMFLSLLGGAISSGLAPHIAQMVTAKDWNGCKDSLRRWVGWTAAICLPVSVMLILGSHWLVRLTLQHGRFSSQDTTIVASVLTMSAIQVPFYVMSRVCYRFVIAMNRTDLVLVCGAINLVLDVVLNLMLMRWMGVAGIALATSLWSVSTFVLLAWWSWKLLARALRAEQRCEVSEG